MSYNEDVEILLTQIKNIIRNKSELQMPKVSTAQLADLQEGIEYLARDIDEANSFLKNLSMGKLEVQAPSRHNFLSANLKELHSGLRHMTWQANQVANGDYSQTVSFLGEFSDSFNQMKDQLQERERKLTNQATALRNSINLMAAIMDGLKDWVVVTDKATGEVLYKNRSASERYCIPEIESGNCKGTNCPLANRGYMQRKIDGTLEFEVLCPVKNRILCVETFWIQWNEKRAYVHFISDVTCETGEKKQLETMAFRDELTGFYNRRYCLQLLDTLVLEKREFVACLFDLDGLKAVNDNFGHLKGDEYIRAVTDEMKKLAMKSDKLCRVGGDEFLILALGCSENLSRGKILELNQKIAEIKKEFPMSVSSGVVYVPKNSNFSAEQILGQADEEMYKAKKNSKKLRG